jgi:predicted nucleotidyltransferase
MDADAPTLQRDGFAERERVLRILREQEPTLRAQGITRLRLFGSMARGEAGPESDVDLIASVDPNADFSLLDHAGVELDLGDLIGRTVEVATAPWKMRPRVKRRVEADAVEVF